MNERHARNGAWGALSFLAVSQSYVFRELLAALILAVVILIPGSIIVTLLIWDYQESKLMAVVPREERSWWQKLRPSWAIVSRKGVA